jgi:hypothetical protein
VRLAVAIAATVGGLVGLWWSLQPSFFPYWPASVASTAWGALAFGLVAWLLVRANRIVSRILREEIRRGGR